MSELAAVYMIELHPSSVPTTNSVSEALKILLKLFTSIIQFLFSITHYENFEKSLNRNISTVSLFKLKFLLSSQYPNLSLNRIIPKIPKISLKIYIFLLYLYAFNPLKTPQKPFKIYQTVKIKKKTFVME